MADVNWGLIILVIAVVLINIVGIRMCMKRRSNTTGKRIEELEGQLADAQKELEAHKAQVNEHFMKTSVLFSRMTDSYRAVFMHLTEGSQGLCSSDAAFLKLSDAGFLPLAYEEEEKSFEQEAPETTAEEPETTVELSEPSEIKSDDVPADEEMTISEEEEHVQEESPEEPEALEQDAVQEESPEEAVALEQDAVQEESPEEAEASATEEEVVVTADTGEKKEN